MTDRPVRLAYLCADAGIPPDGVKGASVHFRMLGRALADAGVELDAVTVRAPKRPDPSFPVTAVADPERVRPGVAAELRALARSEALCATLERRAPHDAVYERLSLFGLAGLAYARSHGIPLLLEVNAPIWAEAARYRGLELEELARAAAGEALRGAACVLVVSEALRRRVCAEGAPPERVRVAPNGVDRDRFAAARPAERPAPLRARPTLVFVGSLKPWHGIGLLLDAFAELAARRPVGLWIVGDGPLRDRVAAAGERWPDRVVHSAGIEHGAVAAVLAAADVALAPYPADAPDYFCPLKIVEAFAAGCPLVASDVACVRELVGDPPRAELFAPESSSELAAAVERVLDRPERARERSERVRSWALSELTWQRRAEEIAALVRSAAEAPTPGGAR